MFQGVAASHYVSQRTSSSFPPRDCLVPAAVSLSFSLGSSMCLDLTRARGPLSPSAYALSRTMLLHRESLAMRARASTERCCCAARYEIIPGGLASRKFITINRTRSDEHLARRIACTNFCITHPPRSRFSPSRRESSRRGSDSRALVKKMTG